MEVRFALMFLCLALALTIHELGHYLAGVAFKTRIQSINIFASPWFHVFSTHDKWFLRLFPNMASRVEVKIGWLPLLAYVRFQEKPSLENTDTAYLQNKAAWQRLIIFSAGVLMNFVSAMAIDMSLRHRYFPEEKVTKIAWSSTKYISKTTLRTATSFVGDMIESAKDAIPFIGSTSEAEVQSKPTRMASVSNQKGGYYRLASHFPSEVRITRLANLLVGMSIGLLVFNLLPVPPLDGGQILFAAYECIARRPPNEHFRIWVTLIGLVLLVASIIYFIYDEIVKDFKI